MKAITEEKSIFIRREKKWFDLIVKIMNPMNTI